MKSKVTVGNVHNVTKIHVISRENLVFGFTSPDSKINYKLISRNIQSILPPLQRQFNIENLIININDSIFFQIQDKRL
jgi:hypothetical protein